MTAMDYHLANAQRAQRCSRNVNRHFKRDQQAEAEQVAVLIL